jgi:hypothetical protein
MENPSTRGRAVRKTIIRERARERRQQRRRRRRMGRGRIWRKRNIEDNTAPQRESEGT